MAGHNRFKKIKHKKEAEDSKRQKTNSKCLNAIHIAAQCGTDPKFNSKLRIAMLAAKAANVPKSTIENAIKRTTEKNVSKLQEATYEGFGPSKVSLIVETITDNLARTYHNIRTYFNKYGAGLVPSGGVSYMFKHLGIITYPGNVKSDNEMTDLAIEAGADDCKLIDGEYEISCDFVEFHSAKEHLEKSLGEPTDARVIWKPDTTVILDHLQTKKVLDFIEDLEDDADVQNVYSNLEIPDDYDPEKL